MENEANRFSNPSLSKEEENWKNTTKEDYGYFLLRKNYKRVKPHSKYSEEGVRPRSPNIPYSFMSDEIVKNNPRHSETVFRIANQSNNNNEKENSTNSIDRFYIDRAATTLSEHLVRGKTASQPYCYIAKDAHNNYLTSEYKQSRCGAYPTWSVGPEETGFRTRSHYVAEPVERFANIDMYKRPPTNQPGRIIFDHGRPNNGYYLQRNQFDNTWFNSSLKLNQTDILKSIEPKTLAQYKSIDNFNQSVVRSKAENWPFNSEYSEKFTLKSKN